MLGPKLEVVEAGSLKQCWLEPTEAQRTKPYDLDIGLIYGVIVRLGGKIVEMVADEADESANFEFSEVNE